MPAAQRLPSDTWRGPPGANLTRMSVGGDPVPWLVLRSRSHHVEWHRGFLPDLARALTRPPHQVAQRLPAWRDGLTRPPRRVAQRLSARRAMRASAHAPTTSSGTGAVCPTWCVRSCAHHAKWHRGCLHDVTGFLTQDGSLCRAPHVPAAQRLTRAPGRGSHSHESGRRPGSAVGFAFTLLPRRVAQRLVARRGASAYAPTTPSGTKAACLAIWALAPTTPSGTTTACPT